jgi:hypothetical protein
MAGKTGQLNQTLEIMRAIRKFTVGYLCFCGHPIHMPYVIPLAVTSKAMPMNNSPFSVPQDSQHLSILYKQLVISLKFHHGQSLCQLPRDLALQAMNEVWESCNSKPVPKSNAQDDPSRS